MTALAAGAVQLVLTVAAAIIGAVLSDEWWGFAAGIGLFWAAEFVALFLFAIAVEAAGRHDRKKDVS
jgi:hypothetical protein